jgi:hypothetical protein
MKIKLALIFKACSTFATSNVSEMPGLLKQAKLHLNDAAFAYKLVYALHFTGYDQSR